jgi:RNA polymerase sigma-70 factor (ECF subfamily)
LGISFGMIRMGDLMPNTFQHSALAAGVVPFVIGGAEISQAPVRTIRPYAMACDNAPDASLVARVADGDRSAIRLLVARHQQAIHRFVVRQVADSATAEDIVSEVFIELWRQASRFEGRAQLSTWLLAIARNKARSAMRRRVDQPLEDCVAEMIPDDAPTAEERWDAEKRRALLRKCLDRLSPAHREMVDLVYYHEKSVEEVSAIIGVPVATVKTRMFYARKHLAALLKAAGADTTHA